MTNQSQAVAVSGEDLSDERIAALIVQYTGLRADILPAEFAQSLDLSRAILSEGTASLVAENERLRADRDAARRERDETNGLFDMQQESANLAAKLISELRTQLAEAQKEARDLRERIGPSLHGGMP